MGTCVQARHARFHLPTHCRTLATTTIAFVHQKELLFGYMTPREYLAFNARAKMATRGYTAAHRERRVNEVGGCRRAVVVVAFI